MDESFLARLERLGPDGVRGELAGERFSSAHRREAQVWLAVHDAPETRRQADVARRLSIAALIVALGSLVVAFVTLMQEHG
jgi:hypothetical protein